MASPRRIIYLWEILCPKKIRSAIKPCKGSRLREWLNFAFTKSVYILTDINTQHLHVITKILQLSAHLVDVVEQRVVLFLTTCELLDQLVNVVFAGKFLNC